MLLSMANSTYNLFLENWGIDFEKVNRGKLGRKFDSPWAFIEFLMLVYVVFGLPPQDEGFLRKMPNCPI